MRRILALTLAALMLLLSGCARLFEKEYVSEKEYEDPVIELRIPASGRRRGSAFGRPEPAAGGSRSSGLRRNDVLSGASETRSEGQCWDLPYSLHQKE